MLLQGKLCASAHMGRRGEMRVAEGSRAGCASVSSVFGRVYLHANERKIISSREALYQLLLRKKTLTQTVSASLQVCPCCFTQSCRELLPARGQKKGMCGLSVLPCAQSSGQKHPSPVSLFRSYSPEQEC